MKKSVESRRKAGVEAGSNCDDKHDKQDDGFQGQQEDDENDQIGSDEAKSIEIKEDISQES